MNSWRGGHYHRIDLHGLRCETAIARIEAVIYAQPATKLEIIHGCGHGILRQAIRDYLQECRVVERIVFGEEANLPGGSGITLVYTFE